MPFHKVLVSEAFLSISDKQLSSQPLSPLTQLAGCMMDTLIPEVSLPLFLITGNAPYDFTSLISELFF